MDMEGGTTVHLLASGSQSVKINEQPELELIYEIYYRGGGTKIVFPFF